MNDRHEETREVMQLWRDFAARHGVERRAAASEAEAIALLREARARVERRALPPQGGLPWMLAQIAAAWQPAWTDELKNNELWPAVKQRLAEVRQLLDAGTLADAGLELESILCQCCRGAERILATDQPRRLDESGPQPEGEALRRGLTRLERWLETL